MLLSNTVSRVYHYILFFSLCFECHSHLARRQQSGPLVVQISDGQVQVPVVHSKTTLTTSIGGAIQTVVLPAGSSIATPTTIPVNVNGQPNVAVIDPSGIVSFLPPNDLLVGTSIVTADPTGFRIGTQEVASGEPVTVNGETFSFGPQGLYIDGIPKSLTGANQMAQATTVDARTTGDRPSTTSTTSGNAEQVGTTTNPEPGQATGGPMIITVGGETVRPEATGFLVGGQTVRPGASAIVLSGKTLSLGTIGDLVEDGTTVALPVGSGGVPARITISTTAATSTTGGDSQAPRTTLGVASVQSSILNATGSEAPEITTLVFGAQTEVFSKETFSDLADLSTTTTVRTTVSNHDSGWITAVPIVVLPGGIWWHGGLRPRGAGGFCFWPFCPPGGPPGGGGSSSDGDPDEDPDENPDEDPDEDDSETRSPTTEPPTTTTSSIQSSSSPHYATITFDGDPMPYNMNDPDLRAWGDTVYERMVADGLGEDVTDIDGVYPGAVGTPLNSTETGVSVSSTEGTVNSMIISSGASSTRPPTTVSGPVTSRAGGSSLSDCSLTTSLVGTTDAALTAGTYTICECAAGLIAGTTTQVVSSSETTYVICSGAPNPTVSTIVNLPKTTSSKYVPPAWQCPNDGVRQNAPGCPTPTTSTGGPLRCETGSNVGVATYIPATWCGCNGAIYETISGATSDYCGYSTVPESTIRPTAVKNTEIAPPTVAAPTPTANCDFWDEVLFWHFEIYNINGWAGDGGGKLKQQEGGCGGMTGWGWSTDAQNWGTASFNLPFTIKKGCVERAIKSAGGPNGLSCTGHGLSDDAKRKRDGKAKRKVKRNIAPTRTYG